MVVCLVANGVVAFGGVEIEVTPAQVDGGGGLVLGSRSISFSDRNISLNCMIRAPVRARSGCVGEPSTIATRRVIETSRKISSRNGA